MTPTYTTYYHTWHTKETRWYGVAASTEATIVTSATDTDNAFYTEADYTNTSSDNGVYAPSTGATTNGQWSTVFKKVHTNNTDSIQISFNGKISVGSGEGCTVGNPCTLQIYQWGNGGGCSAGWGDFNSGTRTDTTTAADTDFTLTGTRSTNLSCYYSTTTDADTHLGDNTVAVRVYKPNTGFRQFQTDVITFTFVPENVLWLLPIVLFLPRVLPPMYRRLKRKTINSKAVLLVRS
jgi:hypothetical protein